MKSIHVIGAGIAGQEGFTPQALELINQSELLFGAQRLLGLFPDFSGETFALDDSNLAEMVSRLQDCDSRVVVLASGDPLFFGLGRMSLRFNMHSLKFVNPGTIRFLSPAMAGR